jgi:hypothetical protein
MPLPSINFTSKVWIMCCRFPWLAPAIVTAFAAVIFWGAASHADERPPSLASAQKGRDSVATCQKVEGALLEKTDTGLRVVKVGDKIAPKALLIGFPDAQLVSADGLIQIALMLNKRNKLPVTEAAIVLNDDPALSADISLERGVIGLKGLSDKSEIQIKVRGGEEVWSLTLKEPGTNVVVARFGRHTPGVKQFQDPAKKVLLDIPQSHFGVLVINGTVIVNTGAVTYTLKAPPGPALLTMDSAVGIQLKHLDKLPEEAAVRSPEDEKLHKEICDVCARLAAGKDFGKDLETMEKSASPIERLVAVAAMGAVDDLPRLWHALEDPKNADVRDQAIRTLRNWIGRKPGQVKKLFEHLTTDEKLPKNKAKTVILLLRGFDDSDISDTHLYQLLIDELEFGSLPLRELAHWHLERLAPAGESIAYDAGADEPTRRKAVAQWRQLIPPGQMPPPPKLDPKKKAG